MQHVFGRGFVNAKEFDDYERTKNEREEWENGFLKASKMVEISTIDRYQGEDAF